MLKPQQAVVKASPALIHRSAVARHIEHSAQVVLHTCLLLCSNRPCFRLSPVPNLFILQTTQRDSHYCYSGFTEKVYNWPRSHSRCGKLDHLDQRYAANSCGEVSFPVQSPWKIRRSSENSSTFQSCLICLADAPHLPIHSLSPPPS